MQQFRTLGLTLIACAGSVALCLWFWSAHTTAQDRGQGTKRPTSLNAEPRIALVIGNAAYGQAPLSNPLNDARDMEAVLRNVGFEVLSGIDRNQRQMKELIRQFGLRLRNGGVGLFYFAGHGVQVGGRNYLIPIGAEINSEAEVEYEAVEAGFVLAQMEEARNRLNVVILDACRNNPYARGFRSGTRGLAGVRSAPSGTLIAYATAADDVAADGNGRNGLFTGELLAQLRTPGLTLAQVFQRTRTSVRSKSGVRQVPFEYTSVEGDEDFYFIRPNEPLPPAPVVSAEQAAWERAKQRGTVEAVRGFLSLYAGSQFEAEAQALLATLEKRATPANSSNTPSGATPTKPTPTPVSARMSVAGVPLVAFSFTTANVDAKGKVINRRQEQAWGFTEDLDGGVMLEVVEVPGGEFLMGSPDNEVGRSSKEGPQHRVRIPSFAMGKYEVTQAQWQAVAKLPKVKIDMPAAPANFKGASLPVELVSWEEAVEFCARLSRLTGRAYRLPTEAEWEYAARARTTTPYAFGKTITLDVVNYGWDPLYVKAGKGQYRKTTVAVGSLGVANAFGLYDVHGNVSEWCEDIWHDSYQGAPTDGSAWLNGGNSSYRVLHGGSWGSLGEFCRSAYRNGSDGGRNINYGFRVVVSARGR